MAIPSCRLEHYWTAALICVFQNYRGLPKSPRQAARLPVPPPARRPDDDQGTPRPPRRRARPAPLRPAARAGHAPVALQDRAVFSAHVGRDLAPHAALAPAERALAADDQLLGDGLRHGAPR